MQTTSADGANAVEIVAPREQTVPFVFASPHSGSAYPPEFLRMAALDPVALRRSEDLFVDRLFSAVVERGAPLLRALFPRAFLDPNREPYELDPFMFEDRLPGFANTSSPRVAAGFGTIPRLVADGAGIYAGKLRYAEAERRIRNLYHPYHRHLTALVEGTRERFGHCVLVDCHSMPSVGGPMDHDSGAARVDFVLGDRHGASCAPALVAVAEAVLRGEGYRVARNDPYAGGFTTRHHGQPAQGVHALQIEINRKLYVDEVTYRPLPDMARLQAAITRLVDALMAVPSMDLQT
ncbi:MAG: N-formylglutamate amidohydrolase [Alphaproteobacteria bacterium]